MEEQKFVVKEVTGLEEKGSQEIEASLLAKHEEKQVELESSNSTEVLNTSNESQVDTESKINDDNIISYIKERYDKDISSVDELFSTTKENEDLPEDVSAYFEYKKETGRGIEDFVKLQQDYDEMDSNKLLSQYYSQTEEGLDNDDIKDLMEDKFGYDERFR
tara:strand:- start:770 stop:1255 length:486 start_codon:yes stop_codon:yes gene_type:complete